MVFVLMIFYVFSFIDRQIISLLVEPIKRDMQISDTQIGLLQGFSFALFYCFLGVPIGWLADRKNRKKIIAVGVIVWSLMSALCGVAKNFGQLFLARVGVGVGEAAGAPPSYSIVSDYFPAERRGMALISVADDGPGIPAADRDRLFEPYFSRREGGTGLGLAIVSAIANDHGGSVRMRDNEPRGAVFVLEFPAQPPGRG